MSELFTPAPEDFRRLKLEVEGQRARIQQLEAELRKFQQTIETLQTAAIKPGVPGRTGVQAGS